MTTTPDLLQLDAALARLLDLTVAERQVRLAALAHADPAQAALLQRLLALTQDVHTNELQFEADDDGVRLITADASSIAVPVIPGYRIDSMLGQGGMASVYAGHRLLGEVEQMVAIKVLRAALPGALDRARFLTEQQVMARLRHPAIATLLDVGMVDGCPYMVLERIDGVPLDQWLPPGQAPLPAIVDVLEQICDALQLAHAHFIVHRDIKPANVLVTAEGRIKLIDFGIAKLIDDSGMRRESTVDGSTPLTLRYASPEQLSGGAIGVTSDVFQVGLLAYWLCCGRWPASSMDAPESNDWLAARLRAETVLLPPSAVVADRARSHALAGDLDAIILKCLAFDPAARYASAADLRADLHRHRTRQPVLARRQTRGYLVQRFLRRHPLAVTLFVAALLLLTAGVSSVLMLAARQHEYATRTERILDTVAELFAGANPYASERGEARVADVVEAAATRFLERDDPDPLFQALMLERLAELKQGLADYRGETTLITRALTLVRKHELGANLRMRLEVQALQSAFARGDLHAVAQGLAASAGQLDGESVVRACYVRAKMLIEQEQLAEADAEFKQLFSTLDQVPDPRFQASVHNSFGILKRRQGNLEGAIAAYREAQRYLDPHAVNDQWETVRGNLAVALGAAGRLAESDVEFRALLEGKARQLGETHPHLARTARNYVTLLQRTARFNSAAQLLARFRASAAASSDQLARISWLEAEASVALCNGDDAAALEHALQATELALAVHGTGNLVLAKPLDQLAWTLFELGQHQAAARVARATWLVAPADSPEHARAGSVLLLTGSAEASDLAASTATPCDIAERQVFGAWLAGQPLPPAQAVPAACSAARAARLAAFDWSPPLAVYAPFLPEPFNSPIARTAKAGQLPRLASTDAALDARLERLLAESTATGAPPLKPTAPAEAKP